MHQVRAAFCPDCKGVRPFVTALRPDGRGGVRRVMRCGICDLRELPCPGIHCRVCGEHRFRTKFTRYPGPGMVIRVKQCKTPDCTGRIRTVERLALAGA